MRQTHQRGIAIGPILYIVAILAVLAAAIAAGSGAFTGDTSAISAKAYATAILEYANEVKLGVDRVIANGCTDTEISFQVPLDYGWINPGKTYNPNSPSDKSCHVFDVNGGGVVWKDPPKGANTVLYPDGAWPKGFIPYFVGGFANVAGTPANDLILYLPISSREVCDAINNMSGITTMPIASIYGAPLAAEPFAGSYTPFTYNRAPPKPVNGWCNYSGRTPLDAGGNFTSGWWWFPSELGIQFSFYYILKTN